MLVLQEHSLKLYASHYLNLAQDEQYLRKFERNNSYADLPCTQALSACGICAQEPCPNSAPHAPFPGTGSSSKPCFLFC